MRLDHLTELVEAIPDATLLVDEHGTVVRANARIREVLGYTPEETVGRCVEDFVPRESRRRHASSREHYQADPVAVGMGGVREFAALHKDGKTRPVTIALGPIDTAAGRFIMACIRDISALLSLRSKLQDSVELNRAVLASLDDHIAVLDKDGRVALVNDAWQRFAEQNDAGSLESLGVGADYLQVCSRSAEEGDETARQALEAIKSVMEGSVPISRIEYACHSPDEKRWFVRTVLPVCGGQGGVVVCHGDISGLKSTELKLRDVLDEVSRLKDKLRAENVYLKEELESKHEFDEIIGQSRSLREALGLVNKVAATDANVLLLGETGTGKELFARAIHQRSRRAGGPLVRVNCAALPSSLIESELFGHVKGAFTGALHDKAGRFEVADRGTLFLDEVGEIDLDLQTKLLRVLQEREFERVGSSETLKANVRIIAATNRNLEQAVRDGEFRSDLYFRLNVFPIQIPPLRARRDDIPVLIWHFVVKKSAELGKTIESISNEAMDACLQYGWPGNVRELENIVERSMILSPGTNLQLDAAFLLPRATPTAAPKAATTATPGPAPTASLEEIGRAHITKVLEDCNWIIKGPGNAADRLGVAPSTLRYRMRKLGVKLPRADKSRHPEQSD